MKTELTPEDRHELICYRLDRAKSTIAEAEYNAAGGYFNTAVNRLYYAAYYAVSALLLKNNLSATSHAGVKTMFSLHFIRAGILDEKYGRTFMLLFENRQSGDYEDFVYCDSDTFNKLLPRTEELIEAIIGLI